MGEYLKPDLTFIARNEFNCLKYLVLSISLIVIISSVSAANSAIPCGNMYALENSSVASEPFFTPLKNGGFIASVAQYEHSGNGSSIRVIYVIDKNGEKQFGLTHRYSANTKSPSKN